MATTIQSFNKGLNTDIAIPSLPEGSYRMAYNWTFTANSAGTVGSLTNPASNIEAFTTIDADLVGYINIGKKTILFFTDGVTSYIYSVNDDLASLIYEDSSTTDGSRLGLDPDFKISGVGKIETSNISKIYWADGKNEVRYMDINKDYTNASVHLFSLVPNISIGEISVNEDSIIEGGNLKAGAIQYTYRLFNKNGAETVFSSVTELLRLTSYIPSGAAEFYGSDIDKIINKSVRIDFEGIDTSFDYIRVYAIFYESFTDEPNFYLVQEFEIPADSFSIIDTGNYPEQFPISELSTIGTRQFVAGDLAEKNNHLFAGNIKEIYFDAAIDCRAYRFSSATDTARIEDLDGTYIIIQPTGDWEQFDSSDTSIGTGFNWSIPETYDCINPDNDIYNHPYGYRDENSYFFAASSGILGGTGKYINYNIYKAPGKVIATSYEKPNTEANITISTTFKTNEVYRVGAIFFDNKGRSSFVNWVGDILIPYYGSWLNALDTPDLSLVSKQTDEISVEWTDPNSALSTNSAGPQPDGFVAITSTETTALNTEINFVFDVESIRRDYGKDISGVQLVYVERKEADQGVYMQGILNSLYFESSSEVLRPKVIPVSFDTNDAHWGALLYSPDITIGGVTAIPTDAKAFYFMNYSDTTSQYLESDYCRMFRVYSETVSYNTTGLSGPTITESVKFEILEEDTVAGTPVEFYWADNPGDPATLSNASFENRPKKDNAYNEAQETYGGTCILFTTDETENPLYYDGNYDEGTITYLYSDVPVFDIVLNKHLSRYGGISYEDRLLNQYIPSSKFVRFTDADVTKSVVAKGDSFISFYEQMVAMYDKDASQPGAGNHGRQSIFLYALESKINYSYVANRPSYYMHNKAYGPPEMGIMEEQSEGIARWPDKYPEKLGDLYSYNPVYSLPAFGLYPKYSAKPLKFESEQDNPVMITASEPKTNGEYVDSWTQFKYANFLEVDSKFGDITVLEAIDNKLYYWQEYAFGTVAVNERSLIQDESGGQLTLGTGGVLERYDYLSTEVGCNFKFAVTKSENALFWYAANKNRIYMYNNALQDLSLKLGITSLLKERLQNKEEVFSMTDFIANETIFTLDSGVLVFDWITQSFTSIYTFDPEWLLRSYDGNYLSLYNNIMYRHNSSISPLATYYGTTYDSYIKMIVNKDYHLTKVFDTISWDTISVTNNPANPVNQYEDTFYRIRVTDDYQNSDLVDLHLENDPGGAYRKNMSRKERSFTLAVPRDIIKKPQDRNSDIYSPGNLDPNLKFKRRMRDKYIRIELWYDNALLKQFSLPYVIVNYRPSFR